MKKVLCVVFAFIFVALLCGCDDGSVQSNVFRQEVTIVKLPSPPKCKTTNSNTVVNEVIDVLGLIEKHPTPNDVASGGWSTMVILKIDGQEFVYTLGGNLFTDSDGRQYNISNCKEIEDELTEIYNKMDAQAVDYP